MPLWRRKAKPTPAVNPGIAEFWAWWPQAKPAIEAAIDDGQLAPLIRDISDRVKAVNPGFSWELTSGRKSRHAFTISAGGNRALRPLSERWLEAGPAPDDTWEYHSARQPARRPHAEFKDAPLDPAAFRIGCHFGERLWRLDVAVFHPGLEMLPESRRLIGVSLFLVDLLGEDDAERWIGTFEFAPTRPEAAVDGAGLRAEIERLRGLPMLPQTTLIQGWDLNRKPLSVLTDLRVKRIDHVLYDRHVTVKIELGGGWPPPRAELAALDELEPLLDAALAGTALWIARTTGHRRRVVHFVARDPEAARRIVDEWARPYPNLQATFAWDDDPEWAFRAAWEGENEPAARPAPRS
jgi:hypothetical protein